MFRKKNRFVIVQNSIKTTYMFRFGYISELLKLGDVIVIAPNDDNTCAEKLKKAGVIVCDIPAMYNWYSKAKAILLMNYHVLQQRKTGSLFICHFLVTFILCYFSLVPFNNKLIIYTEGLGSVFSNRKVLRKILRFLMLNSRATRVFCNKDERSNLGCNSDFVSGGIGIDLNLFSIDRNHLKTSKSFNLLYVGRLLKDKGAIDTIDIFRHLAINNDVQLNLLGDIYPNNPSSLSYEEIEELKQEFGERINFVGFSDDIAYWYQNSDVLLLPSKIEGFPVCVMEASAMGIPSVGYRVPGVRDAIKPEINGLLVEYGDIKGFASAVEKLLNTEQLRYYSITAQSYAKGHFCQNLKNKELIDIIKNIN